jgi:hypothetical protein
MGILDDAIREHLELKRRLGAEDEEIARLEGEAFGPPSRPGDPDFPDQPATGEVPVAEVAAPPDQESEAASLAESEAPTEFYDAEATAVPATEPEPPHAVEPEPVTPAPQDVESDEPAAPPVAEAHAAADESPDAAVPLARELHAITEQPAEPATGEEDIRPEDELDLDLDIDLDEPEDEAAPAEPNPAPEPEPAPDPEPTPEPAPTPTSEQPAISSFDTVEHHFEGAIEDTGDIEVVEGEVAAEPLTGEEPVTGEEEEAGESDEDEDVLEETPEFLRDQPEDDELWFEQGSPKDFDF